MLDDLRLYPRRCISRSFRTKLTPEMICEKVWGKIFKNYRWISSAERMGLAPILVGHDLYNLCYGPEKLCYLVLVDGDQSGDLRREGPNILDCLNPHCFNKDTNEVIFKNSNIILNIDGQIRCRDHIKVALTKIFSRRAVSSAALVWGDIAVRKISRSDITGVREKTTLETVSAFCFFDLSDKDSRWDQVFVDRACPAACVRFPRQPSRAKRPVN